MHFSKIAVAAAAAAVVSAQDAKQSICDKYTVALLKDNTAANQGTLVTLLVKTAALGSFTGPGTQNADLPGSMVKVPGLLSPGNVDGQAVNLAPYFTGELASTNVNNKPTSVNWLDSPSDALAANATFVGEPGTMTNRLVSHLVQYFAAALGCSQYGKDGLPAYQGDNSQYNVHKYMDLDHAEVTWFIQNVGLSAKSFGASDEDVTAVGDLLNKTFNYRCSPPTTVVPAGGNQTQSICVNESCPLDPNAQCSAYKDTLVEPSTVASLVPSSTPVPSTNGTTGGSAPTPVAPVSTTSFTGAAVATAVPAAVAGAAGLLAMLL